MSNTQKSISLFRFDNNFSGLKINKMGDKRYRFSLYDKNALSQALISLCIVLAVGIPLFIVLFEAGAVIFHIDLTAFSESTLAENAARNIGFLKYIIILQDIAVFITPSVIIIILMNPVRQKGFSDLKTPRFYEIILVIILAFCIFPVTSFAGQINEQIHLPDWLSGVEKWMTEKEKTTDSTISLLIEAKTFWVMMLNMAIIAILPAMGEELIFRGVFQKIFYRLFRSPHVAIWFTAFLFSTLHLSTLR